MSRVFTAGPIDFEGVDSLISYRYELHESLRNLGHTPVDQYTELLQNVAPTGTSETSLPGDVDVSALPDEPFAAIVQRAIDETSLETVLETPEVVPRHASDEQIEALVDRDMELLRSCAGLVAYLPRPSCGTMVEIVRASDDGLPVVVISESPPHYVQHFADGVEATIEAGIERIDEMV